MLETLERGNLFVVPLDDKRRWYRYHHLFADVLQARLRRTAPRPGARPPCARERVARTARSTRRRDPPCPGRPELRTRGGSDRTGRAAVWCGVTSPLVSAEWIKALPEDVVRVRPVLCTSMRSAILGLRDMTLADARLIDAERWLEAGVDSGRRT